MEIELKLPEYFGSVKYFIINIYIVMCITNVVQIIAGLTGVAKVLWFYVKFNFTYQFYLNYIFYKMYNYMNKSKYHRINQSYLYLF